MQIFSVWLDHRLSTDAVILPIDPEEVVKHASEDLNNTADLHHFDSGKAKLMNFKSRIIVMISCSYRFVRCQKEIFQ